MNSKNKIWNIASAVVLTILLIAELLFLGKTFMLDMLPLKLFVLLPLLAILGTAVVVCLMFVKTKKKKAKKDHHTNQILAYILSALAIICCILGFLVINKADSTLKAVTNTDESCTVMGVYVLNEDKAHSIKDAKGYTFAYTSAFDEDITEDTINRIDKELNGDWELEKYENVFYMIDAFFEKKIDAIIINASRINLLEEIDRYADFHDKARIIYEYRIADAKDEEKIDKNFDPTRDPFAVYISGSDTRNGLLTKSNSDVNIIATVNPKTKQVLLINTPRDYFVPNPRGNNQLDKLTHCGVYGIDCSIEALENLYDTNIQFYGQVNFAGFKKLIDAIGGVDVYSDVAFGQFKKGNNHLNGEQALAFARDRYSFASGDNMRGKNQMKIISSVIDKLSSSVLIANYASVLDSVEGMFATNMPNHTIAKLIKMQLEDMAKWDVLSYAVVGTGGMDVPYSTYGQTLYVMYPNKASVQKATELIDRVLEGEVLTQNDLA